MCFLSPTSDPSQTMTSTIYAPPTVPVKPPTPVVPVQPVVPQDGVQIPPEGPEGAAAAVTKNPANALVGMPVTAGTPPVRAAEKAIGKANDRRKELAAKKPGADNKRAGTGLNINKG